MLELGLRRRPTELRTFFLPMTAVTVIAIAATHSADFRYLPPFATWATYFAATVACICTAIRLSSSEAVPGVKLQTSERDVVCVLGAISASRLILLVLPLQFISLTWITIAILLFKAALRRRWTVLVWLATGEIWLAYCHLPFGDLAGGLPHISPPAS